MSINSRNKGKRGELEVAKLLTEHGIPAHRGQQFKGSPDSPDLEVEVGGLLDGHHIEVKRTETLSVYEAMDQAIQDAGGKTPVVFHRRNGKEWLVIQRAEDFLKGKCPE